jgi:hypothetical protein
MTELTPNDIRELLITLDKCFYQCEEIVKANMVPTLVDITVTAQFCEMTSKLKHIVHDMLLLPKKRVKRAHILRCLHRIRSVETLLKTIIALPQQSHTET